MKLREVRSWCQCVHGDQRYGDFAYNYHLDRVEAVALRFGFHSRIIRIACQGHDLGEDTGATRETLLAAGFPASQSTSSWLSPMSRARRGKKGNWRPIYRMGKGYYSRANETN